MRKGFGVQEGGGPLPQDEPAAVRIASLLLLLSAAGEQANAAADFLIDALAAVAELDG